MEDIRGSITGDHEKNMKKVEQDHDDFVNKKLKRKADYNDDNESSSSEAVRTESYEESSSDSDEPEVLRNTRYVIFAWLIIELLRLRKQSLRITLAIMIP